jgi:hypothetical protein
MLNDREVGEAFERAQKLAKEGKEDVSGLEKSVWQPDEKEKDVLMEMKKRFTLGYTTMYRPRVEFNDLSLLARDQVDFLAFNTYQPNNGEPLDGDTNAWRSNAIRPVERNKCISTAGHAAQRFGFLKQAALNPASETQQDAASVMDTLLDWSRAQYFSPMFFLNSVLQAEIAPAAIIHVEYREVYKACPDKINADGSYTVKAEIDEDSSGIVPTIVPVDQLYIENFFEPDIQKQQWLIWRRVQSHSLLAQKYGHLPNWKHVRMGMQLVYNDANQGFYYVYDPNMRQTMAEEVIEFQRATAREPAMMRVYVNGILLSRPDALSPREDGLYPFAKGGFSLIRTPCFYYKSLVFSVQQDAKVINTLYPLVIDGAYLDVMQPMVATGAEIINSDVVVPGMVTTFSNPDATLRPIRGATNMNSGLEAMTKVEESLGQTNQVNPVGAQSKNMTAYEISVREQERDEAIGPFRTMLIDLSSQLTKLVRGIILQHFTVTDAGMITDNAELVYKAFVLAEKNGLSKRVSFETGMGDDELEESYKTLDMQGGLKSETTLARVNPKGFRKLKFHSVMSEDVLRPKSEAFQRQFDLETYDRLIQNPAAKPEEALKVFLLSTNEKSARDPDRFVVNQQTNPLAAMQPNQQPNAGTNANSAGMAQAATGGANPFGKTL